MIFGVLDFVVTAWRSFSFVFGAYGCLLSGLVVCQLRCYVSSSLLLCSIWKTRIPRVLTFDHLENAETWFEPRRWWTARFIVVKRVGGAISR